MTYPANTAAALIGLGFRPLLDFRVRDNGDGTASITEWLSAEPQPTPEQIAAAMLPAARASVIPRIKAERERRQQSDGFPVTLPGLGAVRFHSDPHSRSQHAGLFALANSILLQGGTPGTPIGSPQVQWRTIGGQAVPLTVGVVLALMQAALLREASVHAAADAHIAAVQALTDADAVLAYDFSTDWPA